jgi:hypothetical protein
MTSTPVKHDNLEQGFDSCDVPDYLREGLALYLREHIPTGHFLLAVLSNNLMEACDRADLDARTHLWNIVCFLQNYAPIGSWGTRENVRAWLDARPRR